MLTLWYHASTLLLRYIHKQPYTSALRKFIKILDYRMRKKTTLRFQSVFNEGIGQMDAFEATL